MGSLSEFTEYMKQIENGSMTMSELKKHEKSFSKTLGKLSNPKWTEVQDFLLACIQTRQPYIGNNFATPLVDKRKLIKWKDHPEMFTNIFEYLLKYGVMSTENGEKSDTICYSKFLEKLVPLLKANQLLKNHYEQMNSLVAAAVSTTDNSLLLCVDAFTEEMPWNQHTDWTMAIFDLIYNQIQECPEMKSSHDYARCVSIVSVHIFRTTHLNVKIATQYASHIAKIFNYCADQEWIDPDDSDERTIHHRILQDILEDYFCRHHTREMLQPVIESCKKLWESEDDILERDSHNLFTLMPGRLLVDLDESVAELMIDRYISGEDPLTISNIQDMYRGHPHKFHDKIDDLAEAMEGAQDWIITTTLSLFAELAKEVPEIISEKCVKHFINTLKVEETHGLGLMTLVPIAEKKPEYFCDYEKEIEASIYSFKMVASQAALLYVHMGKDSEEKTQRYVKILVKAAQSSNMESNVLLGILYGIKQLGAAFPQTLAPYEKYFKTFEKDGMLKDYSIYLIDIIHGRSLAAVSQDVQEVQEDVENLDNKVTNTEENVENLSKEVDNTKAGVVMLTAEVGEQGERLTELEDVVEETVEKVEEIDKKTLSHAPKWSRDVAILLNPKSDHDWRLLGSRLGYKNDDIRNWATQPDPCLSMFDEWFATHKTREAAHAVLKHLEEMNRMDASMIVENALKQTEDVVEDEEVDYVTPPPVFISYQWGVQDEVKLLKKHLEMAGFECWMDIGQMGGGDKLFEKIDKGIRGAAIIICCVTEKYAKSPNCNREVNLSVNLGKPIIPLLMEKMSWPPPGSMGPIFGEYLFIRFFARSGETAGDDRYWPTAKFQELLMQLRYSVIPNEKIITAPYKEWWSPPEEIIVIKPKDKSNSKAVSKSGNKKVPDKSPDIFISYQWGKQPQIKALYKILTLMGYDCWLDIMQMGGGDSLYDKIDKGVRGCKVVLTCITTKYSLSANCRREVSLADALKKPIVPLLLENMTWPPEGPMSMVFTQLLYIDFCKPDISVQDTWQCLQMGELMGKIENYLSEAQVMDDNENEQETSKTHKELTPKEHANSPENNKSSPQEPSSKSESKKSSSCIVL